ncbi:MAG: V-type ATP synthase subunit I [Clostridiaceae bacterium]|nr:V-type ATP synthase subunit I [Clostridiaceae bacterium]
MNKITLLGMDYQREELTKTLMELGVVEVSEVITDDYSEIIENPDVQAEISRIDAELSNIDSSLECLGKYSPVKKPLFKNRRDVLVSEFKNVIKNSDKVWNSVKEVLKNEEHLVGLKSEENRLNNLLMSLFPWKDLNAPLEYTGTQKTVFQYGTMPSIIDWDSIQSELSEKFPNAYIERVNMDKDQHYLYLIVHKEIEQECLSYLQSHGYNRVTFSGLTGTVAVNIERINKRVREISEERENTVERIKDISADRNAIEILYDWLLMEKGRLEATERIIKTKKVFLVTGWVPERYALEVKKILEEKYIVSVEVEEPAEDEEFPILLENRGIAEAGEPVMQMYSLPHSREIDPNTVMAPFFIIFFGLMFSDGGYGLILSLLSGIILWRFELEDSMRKFMKLMFYCGISTMFWGLMFGGWFGISALVRYAVWFDMVSEPEKMLSWALLFGVIHIYTGFALKAANLIRDRKYLDALFDVGFVYVFYTGAVFCLLPYIPAVNPDKVVSLVNIGKYMLIIGGVLLVLTQGRDKKNIFSKLMGGLSSLYDVVGFLSDVLSYSRLLALGLATGIIASIINEISFMFDFPIVLKIILAVAILIVGHTVNFGINALGAYVHSCRLQYLEFFGKFYTGGGQAFSPLKINTKYTKLKSDAEQEIMPVQTA